LYQHYGTNYSKIVEICSVNSSLKEKILAEYPYIKAQVIYAIRKEYCLTIRDFLARRIRLELLDWEATKLAIPIVADLMAQELGWSIEFKSIQIKEYQLLINSFQENIQ
jgi:glycerol-3-phosphate dehydrogenase